MQTRVIFMKKLFFSKNLTTNFSIVTFMICAFVVILNYFSTTDQQQQIITQNNVQTSLPAGYHLIKELNHTDYIGTPDHPTIDGGIVNTTDGVMINHDNPVVLPVTPRKKIVIPISASTSNKTAFQDDWATSLRVKNLLISAAKEGKLDYVLKKSNEMGLPASVAVVPMIESDYQTKAVSSKGAGGAWQLMPSTAKSYGIQPQDRFEFTKSTDAALKLLNQLHQHYGNWELSFAAYNAGSGRVDAALLKNPKAKTIDDLNLPIETKSYVKKMMGLNKEMIRLSLNEK